MIMAIDFKFQISTVFSIQPLSYIVFQQFEYFNNYNNRHVAGILLCVLKRVEED